VIQRTAALRFFFVATLRRRWAIAKTPYPRKTFRLPKILSPEQVSRLIDAAPTAFYRILLMTLYATGLRRAELAHLQVSDIDSERMVVHVKGGKGRKDRDVMLSPKLLDELRRYVRGLRQRPELWLFPGNRWHTWKRPLPAKSSGRLAGKLLHEPDWEMRSIRALCGTALPLICANQKPICVLSNCCSGIAIWKRPRSTSIFRILV
jgi:integrase